ncbi:MAG: 5-(carboxyamino)imidazole ribonucleotide mutase [bacterium]
MAKSNKPLISIIMGSDSDLPVMKSAMDVLDKFGIPFEAKVSSAHRTLDRTVEYARNAEKNGIGVIIAGAGGAAHLPGVVAAATVLPVIGVPLSNSALKGVDALFSIVQMPAGVPVAAVGIGDSGAVNAALLAVRILAGNDGKIKKSLKKYIEEMSEKVIEKDKQLQKVLNTVNRNT